MQLNFLSVSHPKVQDMQVMGVPDPKYGEELFARICLCARQTATPGEIRKFCRSQIAHHKIPAPRPLRRVVSDDHHQQGAEVFDAPGKIAELGLAEQIQSEVTRPRL